MPKETTPEETFNYLVENGIAQGGWEWQALHSRHQANLPYLIAAGLLYEVGHCIYLTPKGI